MAKEPDDLVVRLLRDIQSTLAQHGRFHEDHTRRFKELERLQAQIRDSSMTALGLAGNANIRNDVTERRLEKREERVERLEADRT